MDGKFGENILDMSVDRVLADLKVRGDFFVTHSADVQLKHLQLSIRQCRLQYSGAEPLCDLGRNGTPACGHLADNLYKSSSVISGLWMRYSSSPSTPLEAVATTVMSTSGPMVALIMAERMKATIRAAYTDHIPSLTTPKPVIDIVLEAAASTLAA
jgi:hypothetical protein